MSTYDPEDINKQTILTKDGDPAFAPINCPTLHEALIEVKNRWPESEQDKALFRTAGKLYSLSDLPHEPRTEA
jgi:hypothetical protein